MLTYSFLKAAWNTTQHVSSIYCFYNRQYYTCINAGKASINSYSLCGSVLVSKSKYEK